MDESIDRPQVIDGAGSEAVKRSGIVAKWRDDGYQVGNTTSWWKIKNPHYSQVAGRRESRSSAGATVLRRGALGV